MMTQVWGRPAWPEGGAVAWVLKGVARSSVAWVEAVVRGPPGNVPQGGADRLDGDLHLCQTGRGGTRPLAAALLTAGRGSRTSSQQYPVSSAALTHPEAGRMSYQPTA
jgi:hypothetical protein